jgi:hypothetical protein
MMDNANPETLAYALAAMRDRPDHTPTLATIKVPTLVIVGDQDAITPPDVARKMQEKIPNTQLKIITAAGPMLTRLPGGAIAWILAGGIAYTAGVVFYLWDRLPFNHAVWHCFVLAGSACHFIAVAGWVVRAQ